MATATPPLEPRRSPPRAPLLSRLFARTDDDADAQIVGPIRGELLGADRLAERARAIARSQRLFPLTDRRRSGEGAPLFRRLTSTARLVTAARDTLAAAADREVDVSPAGEWLLDNYYVLEEHVREIREAMPAGYYRELPKLASGALADYPRVYELAIDLIAHTEGRLNVENISLFVGEFQRVTPLTIGELWAIPAMLRLALLENVRRLTLRVTQRLGEVEMADFYADRLRTAAEAGAGPLAAALASFVDRHPPLTPAFVTRFLQQIRAIKTAFTPLAWLEQWIAEDSMSPEDAVLRSNQRLALTQVMMANSIGSLRAVARLDWKAFVEGQSVLDAVLRDDPSGHYGLLTFGTRDHYRHVAEHLARRSETPEVDVAEAAIELARAAAKRARAEGREPGDERLAHVGYYLADEGRKQLERDLGYRPDAGERLHRWATRRPNVVYFGGIMSLTVLFIWTAFRLVRQATPDLFLPPALQLAMLVASFLPATEAAIGVVNQLVTLLLPPRTLPKLEFRETGIAENCRTVVVVPTLFGSVAAAQEAIEHIEVQFLANRDARLHYAILSDFTDADAETREGDDAIVAAAVEGIRALNTKYVGGADDAFYLFHRPRKWNARQGVWMGWERKRGKLAEFNHVLRGTGADAFSTIVGDLSVLQRARYVITLDSDTVLPPEAAALLVGTLAHPLNRAEYDAERGRVVRGYGILQPRVGVSLPSAHRSRFAAIHSGHPGVDPYTTAVSDVYQDLYGEGSFTGKGIYDIDAFEQATASRFPENTLLSHDLIEGNYARAGLVTDVEVYDDYPARYLTHTRRKHRWIRGDWQLLRWLRSHVPGPRGLEPNRLSAVSRWKITDNLRRSLTENAHLLLFAAGWTLFPGPALLWTALGVLAVAFPWLVGLLLAVVRPPRDKSWPAYYRAVGRDAYVSLQQVTLAIAFLPHQAVVSADAIARTLWRLTISRRYLLEWQTASQVERSASGASREVWRRMWPAVLVAAAIGGLAWWSRATGVFTDRPQGIALTILAIAPVVLAWMLAPVLAHLLSAPVLRRELRLAVPERAQALRYALLHWRYFERFVTAETSWLAADNFQEDPIHVVAPRTSPTNIGLQLLAVASAHDLGFVTSAEVTEQLERTFRTLESMRRFRGHFYNWYDTGTLAVLPPAYVSTVDSGNFAGHLLALRQALLALPDEPAFGSRVWRALGGALDLAEARLSQLGSSGDVAGAAEWQALAQAGTLVRRARTQAVARGGPGAPLAALAEMQAVLDAAVVAVDGVGLPDEIRSQATEWLEWTRTRIARYTETLVGLGLAGDDGVLPAPGARFPTLRELAARSTYASQEVARLEALAARAHDFAVEMDFRFLLDDRRRLFAIGYNATSGELDVSYYDLLASESRLASFLAVAKDDAPVEHWFRLGRTLTESASGTALVSWSGSMFEYLMPLLVMRSFPDTLLDQTYRGAVRRQMAYGAERGTPWGVSESAYNVRDRALTYQYRGFGVPDLALKRGLRKDLVIAPYATMLAVMVEPHLALENATVLEREGALGAYGFREAIDYTRPRDGRPAVVGAYFAHHVGMSLVALTNALRRNVWQTRFHLDPMVRAAELILYERIPRRLVLQDVQPPDAEDAMPPAEMEKPAVRVFETAGTPAPQVALLGNLPYTIMVTNGGGGYSRFEGMAVTRWRSDATRDATGQWGYVQDGTTGRAWSGACQPTTATPDWYRATLATDRVVFHRRDGEIETLTEVAVVPDDHAEVRRMTVTNHAEQERELALTSYGEVVLAPADADRAHPAFANLFVETEWLEQLSAVLASRRPRSAHERRVWCVHVAAVAGGTLVGGVSCETDRARFIGRGRTVAEPAALDTLGPLSGTTGAVLDPIFALRARIRVPAGGTARVSFTTLVATSREQALELADRYRDPYAAQRALDLSWTATQVELRELGITPADAALYQQLAGHLFYPNPALRVPQDELRRNHGAQPRLWAMGISGDWPILLAVIDSELGLPTLRQLMAAHHFWRLKGMQVDLVVLNTRPASYMQELTDAVTRAVLASSESAMMDKPGGVFVRRQDVLSSDDLLMLRATARVHMHCDGLPLGAMLSAASTVQAAGDTEEVAMSGGRPSGPAAIAGTSGAGWERAGGWAGAGGGMGSGARGGPPTGRMLLSRGAGVTDGLPITSRGRTGSGSGSGSGSSSSSGSSDGAPSGTERASGSTAARDDDGELTAAAPPAEGILRRLVRGGLFAAGSSSTPIDDAAAAAPVIESPDAAGPADDALPLLFDNGIGGLTPELDYRMRIGDDSLPPAPWSNVIANERGGFCVTERGAGFAWAENSYFYRLTPWHNDPVSDPAGDALYIRDDETGTLWSATPAPAGAGATYDVRHGAGRSTFTHLRHGITTTLELGVAEHEPVKLALLTLHNESDRPRRLTLTSYAEWVLGALREHTQHQVVTRFDRESGAVFARNDFDQQFAHLVAFSYLGAELVGRTGDRREFLGRNGAVERPEALVNGHALGERFGAGIDPAAALQSRLVLQPGETREIVVLLGAASGDADARALISRFGTAAAARAELDRTLGAWDRRLGAITVRTPSPALDAMLNRWALYQALACRMWARSALYQSSGAYGFRDQLQDTMAFVYAEPALARAHILRSAARQFVEGDVQHWWHPQSGRGVRTKFSDDLAWLPYVVDHYVTATGDATVLDEYVPFLHMRTLGPDEHEVYDLPQVTDDHASVYEHCLRALRRASTSGRNGLPLIGIGDWNDGMNRVGVGGQGESVWLAWFLCDTLRRFAVHCDARGDSGDAEQFREQADAYALAAETNAWDGAWYRRAYFDDGTPLGSAGSDECRIDAIAQSWAVISGAAKPERAAQAMRSMRTHLVDEDARLLMLLTPAFDRTPNDPGYIKGYLPGVRENGAQYTHAALWAVLATARAGDGDEAMRLFDMINPLTHARTPAEVATYKVEPYVVAADVYTAAGQRGRGGWTWYTGSASWLYRVGLEAILGLIKRGDQLTIAPCIPHDWPGFSLEYRHGTGSTVYAVTVRNERPAQPPPAEDETRAARQTTVDGTAIADGAAIDLVDDGRRHEVLIVLR